MELYSFFPDQWIAESGLDEASLRFAVTFYVLIFGFALLVGLIHYILSGIAILNFAKRTHVKNGWLGFVPFASQWMLGRLSDVGSTRKKSGNQLLTLYILLNVSILTYIGTVGAFAFQMLQNESAYTEYPDSYFYGEVAAMIAMAVIMLILSITYIAFYLLTLYRITDNFSGGHTSSFFIGIFLGYEFFPLAIAILLLILSMKEPKFKEPQVQTPLSVPR